MLRSFRQKNNEQQLLTGCKSQAEFAIRIVAAHCKWRTQKTGIVAFRGATSDNRLPYVALTYGLGAKALLRIHHRQRIRTNLSPIIETIQ